MPRVSNQTFLVVSVTITCITALFVTGRFVSNWHHKSPKNVTTLHDCILFTSLVFLGAAVGGYNHFILALVNPSTSIAYLMRFSQALTWLGALMLWGCKVPVLLLYIKLFGIRKWLKIVSYATITISGTIFLIVSSWVTARCSGTLDKDFLPRCQFASSRAGFTLGLVSIFTDVVIFILPLRIVLRLKLPIQKRIGLAVAFASGIAGIVASIISTKYKYDAIEYSTSSSTDAMICTIVECAVALIVACVPSLYGLWHHSIVESGIYARLSWHLSQVFLGRSTRSNSRGSDGRVNLNTIDSSSSSTNKNASKVVVDASLRV